MAATGFNGTDEVLLSHRTEITDDNYNGCIYGGSQMKNTSSTIAVKIIVAD